MGGAVAAFRAFDTEPFGVNPGDAASHQAFIDALDLPFDLLVDEGRRVAETYGAIKPDGSGIARTVVIVGKDGRVLFRQAGAPPPVELLAAIERAEDGPPAEGRFGFPGRSTNRPYDEVASSASSDSQ